jgi:2-polyprenyl-6-methoxyphenol hydroxylase-like FAD-dependent oxidoreductase
MRSHTRYVLAAYSPHLLYMPTCSLLSDQEKEQAKESWSSSVSAEEVLATLAGCPGWDPDVLEIIGQIAPGSCVDWTLIWRDPQPKWASDGGRVVQLGDTAHAFLPTSGNGATQALEDALSLAACLRVAGKGREHVATKVHGKLRFERVSLLQQSGFVHRKFMHHVDLDAAEADPGIITMSHPEWVWGHDPVDYAVQNYAQAERHVLEGAEFQNTNVPPGFVYQPWTIASEMEKERADVEAKK